MRAHLQLDHAVRLEWGLTGGRALVEAARLEAARDAEGAGAQVCAVVVDVLSFTTCVSVALDVGIEVLPWAGDPAGAAELAAGRGAVLAAGRGAALAPTRAETVSLSPASIRAAEGVEALVLPSPNGSTISAALAESGARVVAASLRNRGAVAADLAGWLTGGRPEAARVVVLVPAGERWPDGSLRPGVEDLWGTGAVAAVLRDRLPGRLRAGLGPETVAAARAWDAVEDRLATGESAAAVLGEVASGRELIERGYADDVAIAAELDTSDVVPELRDGVFRPSR